ncbi:ATP-binding protein [Kitasatospora sp. NBC_01287]|uniref:ATP-binding protein n=1 Tax=Kitasatospora sp. NBC_01287 TaxID=2903573 RepID=UPI002255B36F|nr:ATP-binding protein [Kitasatospora sp. NBC_01287]MCX4749955.1 ATP-binding protein [Kitasatospora sp. NBC_01287]
MPEMPDQPPSPIAPDRCWLPCSRQSPARARRLLREFLPKLRDGERFAEKAELLVSELVTNALLHGTRPGQLIRLGLETDGDLLWISVEDASEAPPRPRLAADEESGRGLLLVERLSEKWGWGPREGTGKRVWCACAPGPGVA